MAEVTELAIQDARGEAIEDYRIQQIVRQVEDSIYEFPLRLPSNLALVLRVATVVEGVCVTLDPDYDFIEVASAYLTEEGYRRAGARRLVEETGEQVRESTEAALRTPPKVERMLDRFDRNDFYVRTDLEDSDALLETLAKRVIYGMLLSVGLFSIGLLYALEAPDGALVAAIFSGVVAIQLYRSFRSRRRFGARPQFTRQNLRRRRGPR